MRAVAWYRGSRREVDLVGWPPVRQEVLEVLAAFEVGRPSELRVSSVWFEAAGREVLAKVHIRSHNLLVLVRFVRCDKNHASDDVLMQNK